MQKILVQSYYRMHIYAVVCRNRKSMCVCVCVKVVLLKMLSCVSKCGSVQYSISYYTVTLLISQTGENDELRGRHYPSFIFHKLIPFLALFVEQNITWIFSNLRVSTFQKSMMGCQNRQLLSKSDVLCRPEWT